MKSAAVYLMIGLIRLVSFLPLRGAHGLGWLIGMIMWHSRGGSSKVVMRNLELCFPDQTHEERQKMAKDSLIALGKTYGEMGISWMWPIPKVNKLITKVEGLEYLQKALDDKNGIIIIAPHLGNWELLNHFFRQYLFMTVMYKAPKIPALDKFIFNTRKRVDVGLVPADKGGVLSLFKVLDDKGVIAVLPDQEPSLKSGVFAPFFGQQALTGKLIGELARKTPAYLLCCYAKRLEDGNYGVVLKPANPDIRSDDLVVSATALNQSIEECILDCPEQYQWVYKRFRKQPEGSPSLYRKK
ncbi:lysophospholipid acyltransferase family protein (plasmid) [Bermanella sp. WJH001]|uniref:lysophospholipid acyltransferase family protein n=1 Tax=Bermanella sp. WJH001 TaxID=3048005 RepID=UPI0024BE4E4F|nr:lysophospholipid acyltransferase family protein [Bermanella sp. WJH001]MDJ1539462.1 lysophospholipid acyltransferase family protein [Bermanella sp. WJH001]